MNRHSKHNLLFASATILSVALGTISTSAYNIQPALAAGTCSIASISDGPGLETFNASFTASGNTLQGCRDNLEEQNWDWCLTIPIEGGRHCRTIDSSFQYSGFETLSPENLES